MSVSFYGGETAGSSADRVYSSAKLETTGGVGVRRNQQQEPEVNIDKTLECDTVCFKGKEDKEDSGLSFFGGAMLVAGATALIIGGLGCAHKYNWLNKLGDGKVKDFIKKGEPAMKTCYEWCSKAKDFGVKGYNKIAFWKK